MWWETGVPGEISVLPQVIAQLKENLYRVHLATRCNPTYNFNGESGCKSNYHMKNSKFKNKFPKGCGCECERR